MCPKTPKLPPPPGPPAEKLDQVAPERQARSTAARRGGTGAYRAPRKSGAESSLGGEPRGSTLGIGGR